MLNFPKLHLWIFGITLLAADLVSSFLEACVPSVGRHVAHCAEKSYGLTNALSYRAFAWLLDLIESKDKLVVAAATIAIAGFTLALWRATDKLWLAGEKQIAKAEKAARTSAELAERALVAANRRRCGYKFRRSHGIAQAHR